MSLNCIRGCSSRGRHIDGQHESDTDCWGCEPRLAQEGLLCWPCFAGLQRSLRQAPALVGHIQMHVQPGGSGVNESGVGGGNPARPPLNVAALDDADGLHAMLASWAQVHVEEHPAGFAGPTRVGSRIAADGVAGIKPGAGAEPTLQVCEWLTRHLPWASEQEWAGEYVREVTGTIGSLMARWPDADRARPIPLLRCEECDRRTMVYYPPLFEGGQVLVQCDHPDCAHRVDEKRWAFLARLLEDEKRKVDLERARAGRLRTAERAKAREAAEEAALSA